jgi:hypothetical protein
VVRVGSDGHLPVTYSSDIPELTAAVAGELHALWALTPTVTVLNPRSPRFTFGSQPDANAGTGGRP